MLIMIEITTYQDFVLIDIKKSNLKIKLLNYGAAIYSLETRDYLGNFEDIVMQYEKLDDYINNNIYLNATIGPIAGRVKDAVINTEDRAYYLDKNSDNKHTLHSGSLALSYKCFDYEVNENPDYTEVIFLYEEEKIDYLVKIIYHIYDSKIIIKFEVETAVDFVFNLTNHAYFNLSGNLKSDIKTHQVRLNSNLRHMLDDELIFTGEIKTENDIYNFLKRKNLIKALASLEKTPKGGIDDIYYFPKNDLRYLMAEVYDPFSRRMMKVKSTYDHLVFYTHNNINNLPIKHLSEHKKHYALCFECQKSPYGFLEANASNPRLKQNQLYEETIVFEFFVKKM